MQVYLVGDYTLLIELNERMSSVGFYYKSKKSLIPSKGLFIPKITNKKYISKLLRTPNNYPKEESFTENERKRKTFRKSLTYRREH